MSQASTDQPPTPPDCYFVCRSRGEGRTMSLQFRHIASYLLWYCNACVYFYVCMFRARWAARACHWSCVTSPVTSSPVPVPLYCNACLFVYVQSTLGCEGMSLEFRHIASYLLWYCNKVTNEELLHEVILAVGYFTVLHPDNQVSQCAISFPVRATVFVVAMGCCLFFVQKFEF